MLANLLTAAGIPPQDKQVPVLEAVENEMWQLEMGPWALIVEKYGTISLLLFGGIRDLLVSVTQANTLPYRLPGHLGKGIELDQRVEF